MNKNYLLDTNILSYFEDINSPYHSNIKSKIESLDETDKLFISIITLYEFESRLSLITNLELKTKIKEFINLIKENIEIILLSPEGALKFGEIKSKFIKIKPSLKKDTADLLIASCAYSENMIMVSHDGIFNKIKSVVKDFQVEDWTE